MGGTGGRRTLRRPREWRVYADAGLRRCPPLRAQGRGLGLVGIGCRRSRRSAGHITARLLPYGGCTPGPGQGAVPPPAPHTAPTSSARPPHPVLPPPGSRGLSSGLGEGALLPTVMSAAASRFLSTAGRAGLSLWRRCGSAFPVRLLWTTDSLPPPGVACRVDGMPAHVFHWILLCADGSTHKGPMCGPCRPPGLGVANHQGAH